MRIQEIIHSRLKRIDNIWFGGKGNYWSNLNLDENVDLIKELDYSSCNDVIQRRCPEYSNVIFSPKRSAGLQFLGITPDEIVVDAGCMWGALSISLAKMGAKVIAIDQTKESLQFLSSRMREENIDNMELVCSDLRSISYAPLSVDCVVVNGVLEWIPEEKDIELKKFYGKKSQVKEDTSSSTPKELQIDFLMEIFKGLKKGGRLYLAIENRYDWANFFGKRDAHCDIPFITIFPRKIQDLISYIILGRPYTNWIYSKQELTRILNSIGFRQITVYSAFPNYRFPEFILSKEGLDLYVPSVIRFSRFPLLQNMIRIIEKLIFCTLKISSLSPCFIIIAKKV